MGEDTTHTKKAAQSKEDRFDEMQMRIAMAASRKHTQPQRNYDPSMILRPEDNEGILEADCFEPGAVDQHQMASELG